MNHLRPYVVDRFEGSYVILIDSFGRAYDVLQDELPGDIQVGDILHENYGEFILDEEATKVKREKMREMKEALSKNKRRN